jgi:hypothetical protein
MVFFFRAYMIIRPQLFSPGFMHINKELVMEVVASEWNLEID